MLLSTIKFRPSESVGVYASGLVFIVFIEGNRGKWWRNECPDGRCGDELERFDSDMRVGY
jgi:hypothetical protein